MANVHSFNKGNNSNNYDDIICPISGQLVVIPAMLDDGYVYDMFHLLKHRYDDPKGENLKSLKINDFECTIHPFISQRDLTYIKNDLKNKSLRKEFSMNFKFSNNSLYTCVNYICDSEMKDFIIEYYGEPNEWDVSEVSNINNIFSIFNNAATFNYDISKWNLSNIKNDAGLLVNTFAGNYEMNNDLFDIRQFLNRDQLKVLLDSLDITNTQNNMKARIIIQLEITQCEADRKNLEKRQEEERKQFAQKWSGVTTGVMTRSKSSMVSTNSDKDHLKKAGDAALRRFNENN
jgi:hypothetical protein